MAVVLSLFLSYISFLSFAISSLFPLPLSGFTPTDFDSESKSLADCPNAWDQVKADRGEMEHGDKDIEQLQKETAKKANDAARAG